MEKRKLKSKSVIAFIKAGHSLITLKSLKTKKHFTYKINKLDDETKDLWFVNVLFNPDDRKYSYIGIIDDDGKFRRTFNSKCGPDAPSFIAFHWAWKHIVNDSIPEDKLEIWHEGRCARCGKTLTDPESIESGFGPVCRGKI